MKFVYPLLIASSTLASLVPVRGPINLCLTPAYCQDGLSLNTGCQTATAAKNSCGASNKVCAFVNGVATCVDPCVNQATGQRITNDYCLCQNADGSVQLGDGTNNNQKGCGDIQSSRFTVTCTTRIQECTSSYACQFGSYQGLQWAMCVDQIK